MEMLKSSTIWESASRPLFVRSIWLEAPKTGRAGAQRHFILDYEPRQRRIHSKSAASIRRNKAHATLQHSHSYDFVGEWQDHNQCRFAEEPQRDLLLIVPAKVEPPAAASTQQTQLFQQKHSNKTLSTQAGRNQKRTTLFFRHRPPRHGPLHELYELYSRHSSLQDLQSTLSQANSHADERLAERVLNWLDLAGKRIDTTQQTEAQRDISEMGKRPKKPTAKAITTQAPQTATVATTSNKAHTLRFANTQTQPHPQSQTTTAQSSSNATRSRKQVRYASAVRSEQIPTASQTDQTRSADPVKHITIIFDREGVPVRFNRPVRNIDLCTLSASPSTVRRMAGTLASARLYNEGERSFVQPALKTVSAKQRRSTELEHGAYAAKSMQKRSHDAGTYDAKKQLHIFMPNLPKKGLLTAAGTNDSVCGSVDDTVSGLSNVFSELCKI
ncbi:uncharacterized protein LOC115066326 [Bactrocera dorsalis]|uniref:Uncharacterized protein LOC115066326 n=1 Tax=Bactrocera dorsalis TaxID=27457 RepID=A0A8N4QGN2_BACDO|nr:uncharacterized protein LOC115066326 [Bactrocera dorsalis]